MFWRKAAAPPLGSGPEPQSPPQPPARRTTKQAGDAAEALALAHIQAHGLTLLARNYRTPGRGGGEIDLILREPDGTVVFAEVRQRRSCQHGGAAASVTPVKQRRIVWAARHYLLQLPTTPPCRFDVIAIDGHGDEKSARHPHVAQAANSTAPRIEWVRGAFTADD